jgi:molybdopterin/thiamine biosynthesis adenylyltransferase/rhodanese-related sulfurtransferase
MVDMDRYARHISLPDVGIEGQRLINKSRILVIGAGGLGSPVLLYLAAAGVGEIGIIDDDLVDLSNLQRQIIHAESNIGTSKVESAKAQILSINSTIKITTWNARLSPDNAQEILAGWDIVIDGTDNIPTRYLVDDICKINQIPWIYGSIYRFEGQASVFNFEGGPCYRDLFPEPPPSNAIPSCAEGGVFGVLPGVIGSIQATEAIKIIINKGQSLSGKLLIYDAESMTFKSLKYSKNVDSKPNLEEVRKMFVDSGWCEKIPNSDGEIDEPASAGNIMFHHLSVTEYQEKKAKGWQPFLIDVRSDAEYQQKRVSFTDLQVPHEEILTWVNEIPKDRDIILLCRSGMRSQMAAMFLAQDGYDSQKLYNLDGGIMAWSKQVPSDIE